MLWDSIKKNNEHNVGVILNANYPVDLPLNQIGITALHLAVCQSSENIVRLILNYNANVNVVDGVRTFPYFVYIQIFVLTVYLW
jgi:hypothetical protein